MYHFQCLAVPIKVAAIFVIFLPVIGVELAEMLGVDDCHRVCGFYNVVDHLVYCNLHLTLPKGRILNITEQYEIYKHYKQSQTIVLNYRLHKKQPHMPDILAPLTIQFISPKKKLP